MASTAAQTSRSQLHYLHDAIEDLKAKHLTSS